MGNITDKITEIREMFDPLSDSNSDPVDCKKCGNLAKYRCCVVYHESLYTDSKIYTEYSFLKPYWKTTRYGEEGTTYMFVACDICIGEYTNIFTHYPNGWLENEAVACHYEPANFIQ